MKYFQFNISYRFFQLNLYHIFDHIDYFVHSLSTKVEVPCCTTLAIPISSYGHFNIRVQEKWDHGSLNSRYLSHSTNQLLQKQLQTSSKPRRIKASHILQHHLERSWLQNCAYKTPLRCFEFVEPIKEHSLTRL
jgi:hypothetical protein